MLIREANSSDWESIWLIFKEVVSAGDTYAYPAGTTKDEAEVIWLSKPRVTYVVEEEGTILGTYYLKTNQDGPGGLCPRVEVPAACDHDRHPRQRRTDVETRERR